MVGLCYATVWLSSVMLWYGEFCHAAMWLSSVMQLYGWVMLCYSVAEFCYAVVW